MTELEKRVITAKRKRTERLKRNYHLARSYGYTSEESSIIMNQSDKNIVLNAIAEGRQLNND